MAYSGYADAGSLDFDVNLDIDCSSSSFEALSISDMSYHLLESSVTQVLPDLTDTVSGLAGNQDGYTHCGDRVYSISSTGHANFLSLDAATKTLTLGLPATDYPDVNSYSIEVKVALANHSTVEIT